jgi:hypothetical protein
MKVWSEWQNSEYCPLAYILFLYLIPQNWPAHFWCMFSLRIDESCHFAKFPRVPLRHVVCLNKRWAAGNFTAYCLLLVNHNPYTGHYPLDMESSQKLFAPRPPDGTVYNKTRDRPLRLDQLISDLGTESRPLRILSGDDEIRTLSLLSNMLSSRWEELSL